MGVGLGPSARRGKRRGSCTRAQRDVYCSAEQVRTLGPSSSVKHERETSAVVIGPDTDFTQQDFVKKLRVECRTGRTLFSLDRKGQREKYRHAEQAGSQVFDKVHTLIIIQTFLKPQNHA